MPNSKKWSVIAVIVALSVTCIALSPFVFTPWDMLPHAGGDSMKNVYVFLYHAIYGQGNWFDGMNYPYGEHVVYIDAMPVFSMFLAPFHISAAQGLAILWWTVAAGFVLGIFYLYLILRNLSVHPTRAILFASLIVLCNPQIWRIDGHYSLSLCCIIPMVFYWTLKYTQTYSVRYPVYLSLLGCAVYFMHPYFNGMMLIWAAFFSLAYLLFHKLPFRAKVRTLAIYLAGMAAPYLLIFTYTLLTDPYKADRPNVPWGAMEYYSRPYEIVTSSLSPVWRLLQKVGVSKQLAGLTEGYAYIGFTATVVLAVALVMFVIKAIKSRISSQPVLDADSELSYPLWIMIGAGALITGMGIPFIWNMEWLFEYLPGFRQFRALGRFSWMFYYIATVLSVVILNRWFETLRQSHKPRLAWALILPAVLIWGIDATGSVGVIRDLAANGKQNADWLLSRGQTSWQDFLHEHNHSADDFQAIIPIKYMNQGTEKFYLDPSQNRLVTQAFRASFQLHLPITTNYGGRTALSLAEKQVKISGGPFTYKPLLTDSKSNKPYLMMVFDYDVLTPDEMYLFQSSEKLGQFSDCGVYAFFPDRCRANDARWADSIKSILPYVLQDTCLGAGSAVIAHYDTGKATPPFWGAGAAVAIDKMEQEVARLYIDPPADSILFEFSAWFLISRDDYRSPQVFLDMYNINGDQLGTVVSSTKESTDAEDLWFRNATYFVIPPGCSTIKCRVTNDALSSYSVMDELQIRPANTIVISKSPGGQVLVNNHVFRH